MRDWICFAGFFLSSSTSESIQPILAFLLLCKVDLPFRFGSVSNSLETFHF